MSGGSWNYVYESVEFAANRLRKSDDPLRVAFGDHLLRVSVALHDIEWVDSCDYALGDEVESIRACLPAGAELESALGRADEALAQLAAVIEAAKAAGSTP